MFGPKGSSSGTTATAGVLLRRHRRLVSAALAAASVLVLGFGLMPAPPETRGVVVAAAGISSGHRLTPADLRVAAVAAGLIPASAHSDPSVLIGRVIAGPVSAGEVVTDARLLGGLGFLPRPGSAVLPVRLADARAARLLTQGQHISVLAAASSGADALGDEAGGMRQPAPALVIARDALVLSVAQDAGESGQEGLFGGADSIGEGSDVGLVVLGLDPQEALSVAGAQATHRLSFTLHPGSEGPAPPAGSG